MNQTIADRQIDIKVYGNSGNPGVLSLVPSTATEILDIGCGRGDNARHLQGRGMKVDGISISEKEIELASPYLRDAVLCDVEQGLPAIIKARNYDVVICSHILEHIRYPEKLLQDVRQVLKQDGILIVALPNIMHYKSRWQLFRGNFNYTDSGIWDNTHVKWYTFSSGAHMLSANGMKVIKADVTGELPFASLFKKFLGAGARQKLFGGLKKLSRGFFGYELIFVCKANHQHS